MTASEFANILEHIATPSEPIESEALKLLIQQYPYYQALHILLAQQPTSPADADAQLKKAATYATDRGMLYQLLLKQRPDTHPTNHTPAEEHPNNTDNTTQPQHTPHTHTTEPDTTQPHYTSSLIDWQAELNDVENEIHTTNTETPETPHIHPQPETHTTAPPQHNTTNTEINDEDEDEEDDDDNDNNPTDDDDEDEINNPNNELPPPPPTNLTFAQYLQKLKQPHPHNPNPAPIPTTTTNPTTQPTTQKLKKKKLVKELAKASITENDTLISETLAKLLAIQGKKDKAIKMYRQLSLKYPEKNTYFAAKIEQLKNH